jgi:hypothetical protein
MSNPFDIINQLSTTSVDYWEANGGEKDYPEFMVTRSFSNHHDTVMLANEIACQYTMPKRWQYDFYRLAIQPKKKRFAKWAKQEKDAEVDFICQTYNVNRFRAQGILTILSDDQVKKLKEMAETGGR